MYILFLLALKWSVKDVGENSEIEGFIDNIPNTWKGQYLQ